MILEDSPIRRHSLRGILQDEQRGRDSESLRCWSFIQDRAGIVSVVPSATSQERSVKMEVKTRQASVKGSAETFSGDVWFDVITRRDDYARMRDNVVRFAPGARTAWHAHPGGQTLYVTEGRGLVQSRGGEIIEIRPGDVIFTPPGEWHWHGAAPDHFMTHIAMWESDANGTSATWGDHVSDEEYRMQAQPASKEA